MARTLTCTPAAIADGSVCLECLDDAQLDAAKIYFLDLIAAGLNSTTPRTADELITLGKCYCDPTKNKVRQIYILWVLAELLYASTPTDIADVVEAIKCLKCSDNKPGIEVAILCEVADAVVVSQAPV